jgi:hypothetical protein
MSSVVARFTVASGSSVALMKAQATQSTEVTEVGADLEGKAARFKFLVVALDLGLAERAGDNSSSSSELEPSESDMAGRADEDEDEEDETREVEVEEATGSEMVGNGAKEAGKRGADSEPGVGTRGAGRGRGREEADEEEEDEEEDTVTRGDDSKTKGDTDGIGVGEEKNSRLVNKAEAKSVRLEAPWAEAGNGSNEVTETSSRSRGVEEKNWAAVAGLRAGKVGVRVGEEEGPMDGNEAKKSKRLASVATLPAVEPPALSKASRAAGT